MFAVVVFAMGGSGSRCMGECGLKWLMLNGDDDDFGSDGYLISRLTDMLQKRFGLDWLLLGEYVKRLKLDVTGKGSSSGMAPGSGGYVKAVLQGLVAGVRFLARF